MIIETVDIDRLNPAVYNPRKDLKPGDPDYEKLKKSILAFDMVEPLVWNKQTGNLVGGHQRLKILKELGHAETEVSVVDLNETKEKALNLALNKISGEWDFPKLKDILEELDVGDLDIEITGFDLKEIEDLMTQFHVPSEGLTDDDAVPDAVESISRRGDLWQLGNHRLLCGDATVITDVDRLMGGEKADMVFTDPPYGIDYSGGRTQTVAKKPYGKIQGDANLDIHEFVNSIIAAANGSDYYVCLSPINCKEVLPLFADLQGIIVWKKPQPGLGYQWIRRYCEFIIFGTGRDKHKSDASEFDFWDIDTDPKNEYQHGTQKPVALSSRAIRFSSSFKGIVLDPFGGSGSTLIACEKLNRRCYMMEIDEHYCDVIIQRWQDFTGRIPERLNV